MSLCCPPHYNHRYHHGLKVLSSGGSANSLQHSAVARALPGEDQAGSPEQTAVNQERARLRQTIFANKPIPEGRRLQGIAGAIVRARSIRNRVELAKAASRAIKKR